MYCDIWRKSPYFSKEPWILSAIQVTGEISKMHTVMLIVFNQRKIMEYTEELMIKLATSYILWAMEFDKANLSIQK